MALSHQNRKPFHHVKVVTNRKGEPSSETAKQTNEMRMKYIGDSTTALHVRCGMSNHATGDCFSTDLTLFVKLELKLNIDGVFPSYCTACAV